MTISKELSVRPEKEHVRDAKRRALLIAEVAQSKHAEEIVILHVTDLTTLADFFIICTAETEPQIRAISEGVNHRLSKEGIEPLGVEGREGGVWLLMDYGDVILHVFQKKAREFYSLDRLWGDAPQIFLPETADEAGSREGGAG